MSKRTDHKWGTKCCGRCGNPHHGYSGKLDKNGIEYVVCGETNKRMNISGTGKEGHSFAFPTTWVEEKMSDDASPSPVIWFVNGMRWRNGGKDESS